MLLVVQLGSECSSAYDIITQISDKHYARTLKCEYYSYMRCVI